MGASFKDFIVWQRAVELSLAVYKFTFKFPESERFGLTNQLRRAAVSVASNIAEGYGRSSRGTHPVPRSCARIDLRTANSTHYRDRTGVR